MKGWDDTDERTERSVSQMFKGYSQILFTNHLLFHRFGYAMNLGKNLGYHCEDITV